MMKQRVFTLVLYFPPLVIGLSPWYQVTVASGAEVMAQLNLTELPSTIFLGLNRELNCGGCQLASESAVEGLGSLFLVPPVRYSEFRRSWFLASRIGCSWIGS